MKKLIYTAVLTLVVPLPTFVFAQQNSGVISFDETIHFEGSSKELPEGLKALFPKQVSSASVLYYNTTATLYENDTTQKSKISQAGDGFQQNKNVKIEIQTSKSKDVYYFNILNHEMILQTDLMGRTFLVSKNEKSNYQWKLTGKQKKILGYPCNEAELMNDSIKTTAWFTSSILVQSGPAAYYGLPGMILELNMGKGLHIEAKKIRKADEQDLLKIAPPQEGKKISEENFSKLQEKKAKELEQFYGGKNGVIIRTSEN